MIVKKGLKLWQHFRYMFSFHFGIRYFKKIIKKENDGSLYFRGDDFYCSHQIMSGKICLKKN